MPRWARFDVVVRVLQQAQDDVLHVLADIAGLGQRGGVGDGKGNIEHARQRPGEQRFAGAGVADQQDIALLDFDVAVAGGRPFLLSLVEVPEDAFVMVVNGDGERLFGVLLADTVQIEMLLDLDAAWGCPEWAPCAFLGSVISSLSRTFLQRMTQLSQM